MIPLKRTLGLIPPSRLQTLINLQNIIFLSLTRFPEIILGQPPTYILEKGTPTWMSQEVSKCLVNGLQPTCKWGILGL